MRRTQQQNRRRSLANRIVDRPLYRQSNPAMTAEPPLVVHVVYALGTGGLENGLINLINRTPTGRYRHAIICLTQFGDFASRITTPDVPISSLGMRPGHDLRVYWRLWRALRRLRPRILHTRNIAALEMQLLGLFSPGLRRLHGEHGRDVYDLDGSNPRYQRLRRWLAPMIDCFIAVSRDLSDWLVDTVGIEARKVEQIYNGVDGMAFRPRAGQRPSLGPAGFAGPNACVIGTVGRLAEVKDQATLIRAVSLLVDRRPALRSRVRLVVIGDGPSADSLHRLVDELGLREIAWLPGDRGDVPELLRYLDIFVLPSLAEGISNTILEAMASGLPVIATDTGGNPELVQSGKNGFLFPVGDVAALADLLEPLIDDSDKAAALGRCGREITERRFDWANTVERYLDVYDRALGVTAPR